MKEYFFENDGDIKHIFEIPKVYDAYDWEEKQIIPTLRAYDIFGTGAKDSTCSYFDKGSEELQFIRDVITEYGSISFGKDLTIGIVKMTEEEFKSLPED
jgi:hypothetical protein